MLIAAWIRLLPVDATLAGVTAAFLWGIDVQPTNPIEVILPLHSGVRSRSGLTVRRAALDPAEVTEIRGFRVTGLHRTLLDLCARLPAVDALIAIDMAVRLRRTSVSALTTYAADAAGRPGASRLGRLAVLTEPAESPMETRLRWLLIEAGLPRPEVQKDLRDDEGRFVGRADLYYRSARLVIEYDGTNHRDRLVEDNRRQNILSQAGFKMLRFTAPDLQQPDIIKALVISELRHPRVR